MLVASDDEQLTAVLTLCDLWNIATYCGWETYHHLASTAYRCPLCPKSRWPSL